MPDHLLGRSIARLEDTRFLTGEARYVADLARDGELHAVVLRSPHAHARLVSIDAGEALAQPGVVAVHTGVELAEDGLGTLPCLAEFDAVQPLVKPPRPALAVGRVRHVGDPVAMVLAESRPAAVAASERVAIDFDPLPSVVDSRAALDEASAALWDEAPGNRAFQFQKGDLERTAAALADAEHVVELEIDNHRVSALPVEPRAGYGEYDPETGRFTLTATAQGLHEIRRQLAEFVFRLPVERFRVRAPDVGGGFGLKNFLYPEWVLVLWAARRHRRPVRWVGERGEDLSAAAHGRDVRVVARLGLDRDGRFKALHADVVANLGAYLSGSAPNITTRSFPTALGGIYAIANISMRSTGVFTNTAPVDAYRGAGKPEANYLLERLIDEAARRHGFDPVALRLANAVSSTPYRTALGMALDSGRFGANIEAAMRLADRDGFNRRLEASALRGRLRGFGVGCFLETARGNPQEGAEVRFASDGQVELRVGTESHGQGHETAYTQIAGDRLGLGLDVFRFIQSDTAQTRLGFGHGGARSMHMGGGALVAAIDGVLAKAREAAARLLQTDAGALRFEAGRFAMPGTGQSLGLIEIAQSVRAADRDDAPASQNLDTFVRLDDCPFTFPNGCHVAEVEVDPETGAVELVRYLGVDDYGALVNPRLTEGQVVGGVVQGIGQALLEHVAYEPDSGQLLSGSLMDYGVPKADSLPAFEVHLEGEPTSANPLGVKGSGQAGCIVAPQAVMNAVAHALAPLGVGYLDMPATSEKIWRAIRAAGPVGAK